MHDTEDGVATGPLLGNTVTQPRSLTDAQIDLIEALMGHIEEPENPLRILRDSVYTRLRSHSPAARRQPDGDHGARAALPGGSPQSPYRARQRDAAGNGAV